ncbi:putative Diguanylate cyclase [Paraburkholderia tropica]|uniref:putative bifunctional diguanylate cyclase/phosphodiesterase n=1 Tax=Paraburkholderia tropica TaxID=92647 RepID=UPI001CB4135C|nr:EAL domain-containing protein [Paraburkholderia tropica]CAG9200906.1 putative Diguanylate cyclase [Paraburkholderia tropica]
MRASTCQILRHVLGLAATVLATVFALSCLWEFKLERWAMHALGFTYEPSFEFSERWRFILTSSSFAIVALIAPSIWLSRSLRTQKDGYSALRRAQVQSEKLARHDPLTGLFNRRVFNEHLAAAFDHAQGAAVFLIDLDDFKRINDGHGHAMGDKVLCELAGRLRHLARHSEACVARIGGDEFAMIVNDIDKTRLAALAIDILAHLGAPLASLDDATTVSATVGISIAHLDADLPDALLHCADHAMYRGKSAGRATFHFYEPGYEKAQQLASQFESDLALAIEHDQIEPFFQPIVSLPEQHVVGFEILARWRCPQRGLQAPVNFVPVADRLGLIPKMTFSLLARSIECARDWPDHLTLAINVTTSMLEETGFADRLHTAITEQGWSARRLEIEITEQALVSDIAAVRENLSKLQSRGITVALDDFGTGYSGIYHLTHLSIDKIKIDRSFLNTRIQEHEKVVAAVLGLARSLRIKATAEGVEDEDVVLWLSTQPCDFAQGYLFGKPMPAQQVSQLVEALRERPRPLRSDCGTEPMPGIAASEA